jgi:hypothetical protein
MRVSLSMFPAPFSTQAEFHGVPTWRKTKQPPHSAPGKGLCPA